MTDVHIENHSTPIKGPKQLVLALLAGFLVPVIAIVMLTQLVTSGMSVGRDSPAMSPEAVAKRLKPVGELVVGNGMPQGGPAPVAAAAPAPAAPSPMASAGNKGEQVFNSVCTACHSTGAAGAPKLGDKAAWEPRIKQGKDVLYNAALHGLRAMPPKGGNPSLSDADVKAAVDYMVSKVK